MEAALAAALEGATAAGQWSLVGQIAGALEARRRERQGASAGVVELAAERDRRGAR